MCRILAVTGKDWQIDTVLEEFGRLAEYGHVPVSTPPGHKDGWGIAAYNQAGISFYTRSTEDAFIDPKFREATGSVGKISPDVLISHFRKASIGSVKIQNTHPFLNGKVSFCHNGGIRSEIPLAESSKALLQGETDSERFFFMILEKMRAGASLKESLKDCVRFARENFEFTAVNLLMSDGDFVWALREVSEKNEIVQKENLLDYYSLLLAQRGSSFMICSEKLPSEGEWRFLENHELIEIDVVNRVVKSEVV